MAFDFGKSATHPGSPKAPSTPKESSPSVPTVPAKGAAKAPAGFDFGSAASKPSAPAGPQFNFSSGPNAPNRFDIPAAATEAPMRCPNCGAQMTKTPVPANLPSHAPRPPELTCPRCHYRTPY